MAEVHPAVVVLLASGLLVFWLTPISAWWMLARPVDSSARMWFTGTALYALVATLFVFSRALPGVVNGPVVMGLAMASVACMVEAVRRELSTRPPPLAYYGLGLGLHMAAMLGIYGLGMLPTLGMAVHLVLISALEIALCALVNRLRQKSQSRALWLVMLVLLAFIAINLARAAEIGITARPSVLLQFSWLGSVSLVVNYVSVVFYCYGYWGYALEKSRHNALLASEKIMAAELGEAMAREREQLANELLRQRTAMLEQLSRVGKLAQSGALSATIAHEINQPLAAIQLNTGEALRCARELNVPEVLERLLGRIDQDNRRAAQIVSRVRKIFVQGGGNYTVESLDQMVRTVLPLLEPRLKQSRVELTTDLAAPAPFKMAVDELQHCLINLLENALDSLVEFAPSQKRVQVSTWINDDRACFAISDSGHGIPPELRDSIFDLLSSTKDDGMGVGLWLARFIVEKHGGALILDESFRSGARFVISLPMKDSL